MSDASECLLEPGLIHLNTGTFGATSREVPARAALLARHRITIRQVDQKQFNGLRASLHTYNDATHVDALIGALRGELA